jgi:uncharacterized protein YkvS
MPSEQLPKNLIEQSKEKDELTAEEIKILNTFREEITNLKKEAKIKQITGSTELPKVNLDYLTLKDFDMWNRCKFNSIALDDVGLESEYNKEIELEKKNENIELKKRELIYNSRHSFIAFLRQRLTFSQLKEQQKIHKEKEIAAIDIVSFRRGIGFIIEKIRNGEKKGTMYDLTFVENLDDITSEDAYMWGKIINGKWKQVTEEELKEYIENTENSGSSSRQAFARVINQKYTSASQEEQTDQLKNPIKKKPIKKQKDNN